MSIATPDIFARIYAIHGHRCPMSTLGGRLGLAVKGALEAFLGVVPDWGAPGAQAVYRTRTCALDGIAVTLGCSEKDGTLRVDTDGLHHLQVTVPGYRVSAELAPVALQLAGPYRQLANRLEAGWDNLDELAKGQRQGKLDAALDVLLPKLWSAADSELILLAEDIVV